MCNNVKVFAVTFDQVNVSLLNKIINLIYNNNKRCYWSQTFEQFILLQ